MSGHSKWANIKHRKAASDSKKAKVFTKVAKEIMIAAKSGGDPNFNPTLRLILQKARAANMPNANIERAIQRGTGELGGEAFQEIMYEAYAPHAVGLIIEVVTDNKNRAVAEMRHAVGRGGGTMASEGAVSWQFKRKGLILIDSDKVKDQDDLFLVAADAGADDVDFTHEPIAIYCPMENFQMVQDALHGGGYTISEANLVYIPDNVVELDYDTGSSVMRLIETLEELDDVQNVYSSMELSEEAMSTLMGED